MNTEISHRKTIGQIWTTSSSVVILDSIHTFFSISVTNYNQK